MSDHHIEKRDPKVDPRPGDQFRRGKTLVTVQPCGIEGLVFFIHGYVPRQIPRSLWSDWIRDAVLQGPKS